MRARSLLPAVLVLLSSPAQAQIWLSPHQAELQAHRREAPVPRHLPPMDPLVHPPIPGPQRVVYGYLPYWAGDLDTIRWSTLTHLAWFCVEMDATGHATARHGWPDTAAVGAAHAAGVRVDLTFTLFNSADILALCSDPAKRAMGVTTMVDLMEEGGADGISVDFEGLSSGTRDHFTAFITELRAELTARGHPGAGISIAGPSSYGLGEFDLPALLNQADYYFIMAYGFFWSGSSRAGPPGLLRVTEDWTVATSLGALRSVATISAKVSAAQRRQLIYGVPYYGREYVTDSDALAAAVVDQVGSVTYSAARAELAGGKQRRWHAGSSQPWYAWQEQGAWHQAYYEDEESLAAKYQLAWDQDLGGIGIWALNYDQPHTQLWDVLGSAFATTPPAVPGDRFAPLPVDHFPFHDERDTAQGPSRYFNFYSCAESQPEYGREWVYRLDFCQSGTLSAHVPDYPDRDPDLHLLSAPDQEACLARAHTDLRTDVNPGEYLLTVDTWVGGGVEQEGAYALDLDFTPAAGSPPCAAYLACQHGACRCADPARTDCGAACVNLVDDPAHCGSCGRRCPSGRCEDGGCTDPPTPDAGVPLDAGIQDAGSTDASPEADAAAPDGSGSSGGRPVVGPGPRQQPAPAGCGCRESPGGTALALVGLLLVAWRRRPARAGRMG